jgi:predicted protein tyrosine phosphatase
MIYSNSYLNKPTRKTKMTNAFEQGTKNSAIFDLNAPYNNSYQGKSARWLFVCSAGLLRSPTGAAMAVQRGINARSCGSHVMYALIPISANLVMWADKIIFVNPVNYDHAMDLFSVDYDYKCELEEKSTILTIMDEYDYMDPKLQELFSEQLFRPQGL